MSPWGSVRSDFPGLAFRAFFFLEPLLFRSWQLSLQVHCWVASTWKRISSISWGHSCLLTLKSHSPVRSSLSKGFLISWEDFHCQLSLQDHFFKISSRSPVPPWEKDFFSTVWRRREMGLLRHSPEELPGAFASSSSWVFHLFLHIPLKNYCCSLKIPGKLQPGVSFPSSISSPASPASQQPLPVNHCLLHDIQTLSRNLSNLIQRQLPLNLF